MDQHQTMLALIGLGTVAGLFDQAMLCRPSQRHSVPRHL